MIRLIHAILNYDITWEKFFQLTGIIIILFSLVGTTVSDIIISYIVYIWNLNPLFWVGVGLVLLGHYMKRWWF